MTTTTRSVVLLEGRRKGRKGVRSKNSLPLRDRSMGLGTWRYRSEFPEGDVEITLSEDFTTAVVRTIYMTVLLCGFNFTNNDVLSYNI